MLPRLRPRNEEGLFLFLCRQYVGMSEAACVVERLKSCRTPRKLSQLALTHNVYPTILYHLRQLSAHDAGILSLATQELEVLGKRTFGFWAPRRDELLATVGLVRQALADRGVRFAFMRGVTFADRYYRDGALRVCDDVDLLVPPDQRLEAISALQSYGLTHVESPEVRHARAEFMGQCEVVYPDTRVSVDVNWLLTGNAGIGKVAQDETVVWARSTAVDACEYVLSFEDEFIDIVRHVAHGHDFERGMIRAALDIEAGLVCRGNRVDTDYILKQLTSVGCLYALRFLGYFCDHVVHQSARHGGQIETLFGKDSGFYTPECRAFSHCVLLPQVRMACLDGPAFTVARNVLVLVAKQWAVDSLSRLVHLYRLFFLPPYEVFVLETRGVASQKQWRKQVSYFGTVLLGFPIAVLGGALRLAVSPFRLFSRLP